MTSRALPADPAPGARVGAYEVLERVAGAGIAYRVRRGRRLYVLRLAARGRGREAIDGEIAALRRVRHPGIARVRAGGWWPDPESGRPYLVTDLVPGEPFGDWCAGRKRSVGATCRVLEKVARAIEHLRRAGLGCEIGMDSVLVREGGEPLLVDLGFPRTGAARRAGSELRALGALLYQSLAGRAAPRRGNPKPSEIDPRVPPALDELAARLLAKGARGRPASAGEVAEVLARVREVAERGEQRGPAAGAVPARGGGDHPLDKASAPVSPGRDRAADEAPGTLPFAPGGAPFDPPTAAATLAFDDGRPAAEPPSRRDRTPGTPTAIREVKARLAASSPRRSRVSLRAVVGAAAVVLASAVAALAAGRPEPTRALRAALPPAAPAAGTGAPPPPPLADSSRAGPEGDARAIDEDLEREFGRPTVMPDGGIEGGHRPADAASAPSTGARPAEERPWLKRSERAERSAPAGSRGIPLGFHIPARLLTGLDSRTAAGGPVEAVLPGPAVARGGVVLPAGTLAFGTAAEGGGRFTVRFTRLRLPDDSEVAFEGIALAREDGKPGLPAGLAVEREGDRGEGAAARLARGAGGALLDAIAGGLTHGMARNLGEAVVARGNAAAAPPSRALLLDAGLVFDIFVERSF